MLHFGEEAITLRTSLWVESKIGNATNKQCYDKTKGAIHGSALSKFVFIIVLKT